MQLITARELLPQALLLIGIERFNRQGVTPRQLHHHIAEALTLQLHEELEAVAAGPTGEAVIELLGRRHRHRRRFVVMKGAEPHKFTALLFEHHVLTDHINDVGPFLDRLNRAGMKPRNAHGFTKGASFSKTNRPMPLFSWQKSAWLPLG